MNKDLEDAGRVPRDAASQLFKPGTRDEKLLQSAVSKTTPSCYWLILRQIKILLVVH
jgi:hypothetical protein